AELPAGFDIDALPPEHLAFLEQPAAVEAALGQGKVGSVLFVTAVRLTTRLQKIAVEETRLGSPLLFGHDLLHGLRTILPAPIGPLKAPNTSPALEPRVVGTTTWTLRSPTASCATCT